MINAVETIKAIIRNKVAVMNLFAKEVGGADTWERHRNELTGMLICLKNIDESGKFYCINYGDDGCEFGYYDADGKWYSIEK